MKQYRTKSPQLAAWIKTQITGISCEILPLKNNPAKTEFVFSPADDRLYRVVAAFSDPDTLAPLSDYLHQLGLLRDQMRTVVRGGGAR